MFGSTRGLRRIVAVAVAVGAMFALPAGASAATTNNLTSSGSTAPGTVRQYSLTFGNTGADWSNAPGTISVDANGGIISNVQYTDTADLPTTGTTFPLTVTPDAGNAGESFVITFDVLLPKYYDASYEVTSTTAGGNIGATNDTETIEASAGGPSNILFRGIAFGPSAGVAGVVDKWVIKGGTATGTMSFTNFGTGAASHVLVRMNSFDTASYLSPEWAPNPVFAPVVSIPANGACVAAAVNECEIPSIAPGATVAVPISVSDLTHFGSVSVSASVLKKDDSGNNTPFTDDAGVYQYNDGTDSIEITDGTTNDVRVDVEAASSVAAGNTPVAFSIEVANSGPQPITNGILQLEAESVINNAIVSGAYTDAAGLAASIQGPVTFNGVVCTATVNHSLNKTYADRYDCPIASLAAGARITGTVTAKFATTRVDQYAELEADLYVAGFTPRGSNTGSGDEVNLNVSKTMDLQVTTSAQALVGADRTADVAVSIKNAGNTLAEGVLLNGDSTSGKGVFDAANLPTSCTGIAKPMFASCSFGEIAPGATKTIVIPVKAGKALGLLPVSFSIDDWSSEGREVNYDDNSSSIAMQIVKANTVPLLGVKLGKATAQKMAVAAKSGVKTLVTVPNAATIKVDLRVTAKVAKSLGIAAKPKKGKKAPMWYTIGTSTTKAAAAGNVTTTTKLGMKYKAKLLKAKKKFVVQRMVTVVSTAPKNAGANSLTTQNLSFTPAKKAKKGKK